MQDNTGLIEAFAQSEQVVPIFIFDPRQCQKSNQYRSLNALQFMINSLHELEQEVQTHEGTLLFFEGIADQVIKKLLRAHPIDAVFCNRDYTPFSIARDKAIAEECASLNRDFLSFHDILLHAPEQTLKSDGTPYAMFTPYYKNALTIGVQKPRQQKAGSFYKALPGAVPLANFRSLVPEYNNNALLQGGRTEGLALLRATANLVDYAQTRDIMALSTSHLSAHCKFGTLSLREIYWHIADTLGPKHPLLRQLFWRQFFTHIAFYFPLVFGSAYKSKYNSLPWKNDPQEFEAWCQGMTGFPIVDASMRELNATGYMHNRARLIVGSFLTKDLHIDWRWAEKYFAQNLIDYDPSVNNGNWQWVASTGCDAQPYFRIFNPWLQQKKFDPHCEYIKKWVPELAHLDNKLIHTWYNPKVPALKNYPKPIVDHSQEATISKKIYRRL